MHRGIPQFLYAQLILAAALVFATAVPASAAILHYAATLNGASESPPNASTGSGNAEITIDDVALTMRVQASFTGLLGNTTACHIHAPTAVALTGTAAVATTTPFFAGFPIGVKSGLYDLTLDLTAASSFNPSYITANGGTALAAQAVLLGSIATGNAYFNIHSTVVPGGEIRGFLQLFNPVPTEKSSWARVKSLYR
jgi:hypothetical protein